MVEVAEIKLCALRAVIERAHDTLLPISNILGNYLCNWFIVKNSLTSLLKSHRKAFLEVRILHKMSSKRTLDQMSTFMKKQRKIGFPFGRTESGNFDLEQAERQSNEHRYRFNMRQEREKTQGHITMPETIWVDGKLITRPKNLAVSFGILLYKEAEEGEYTFLLGKIPQGNAWTVFKGLPDDGETPHQTAIREFREETSIPFPFDDLSECKVTTLFGRTSNKLLEIYLVKAPENFSIAAFDVESIVKIDSGYMEGKPEIIEIQFLTKQQAVEGTKARKGLAKIYKSQIGILDHAQEYLKAIDSVKDSDESE